MIHHTLIPIAEAVSDALEDYPHAPRTVASLDELRAILYGRLGAERPEAYAGVKYLIESYAYLRLRNVFGPAAWVVVFRDGIASEDNLRTARQGSEWIEHTTEYHIALNKAMCETTPDEIYNAAFSLKFADRLLRRAASPTALKAINKERERVMRTLSARTMDEYEALMVAAKK
ncbi:hypothetical protein PWR63_19375 [Paraburkholderia sp. A2WS-5]|uniref:hypothetical protein n=1 Tax=unclassified Paraburkholderia TaxID=2615204 RepID=UPI003B7749C6